VTQATRAVIGTSAPSGVRFRSLGRHRLPGLPEAETLFQVLARGLRAEFPPPRPQRRASPRRKPNDRRAVRETQSRPAPGQLEIARSLMHDPVVFLIDEPTAGVEPRVAALIYDLIRGLAAQGKAVLLGDQNIKRALEIADHVYVMRTGTVLSEGSREAFGGDTEALVARWLYASGDAGG